MYSVESDEGKKSEEIASFFGISKEILQSNSKVEKNLKREVSQDYIGDLFHRGIWGKKHHNPNIQNIINTSRKSLKNSPKSWQPASISLFKQGLLSYSLKIKLAFGRINIVSRSLSTQSNKGNCIPTIGFYAYTTVYPEPGENYSIISPVNNTEVM